MTTFKTYLLRNQNRHYLIPNVLTISKSDSIDIFDNEL